MKKYIFATALALCVFVFIPNLRAEQSTMVFENSEFNFGTIEEADGEVSHTFIFTNTGSNPIVIENVATTCGCTTPTYTRSPIRPDQQGQITITYDPAGRPGRFSRDVVIVSNSRKNKNTITIKGVVNPRQMSIEDEYPYQIEGGLRMTSLMSNFSYLEHGKSRSMVIGYANATDATMEISVAEVTGSPAFNVVAYPSSIAPGERGSLTLTYDILDNDSWGYIKDSFYVVVDGQKNRIPVTTSGVVVEKYDPDPSGKKKNSPQAVITEVYYDLGNMKNNSYIRGFSIENTGSEPLVVQDVALPKGFSSNLKAKQTIGVGEKQSFEFTVTPALVEGMYMDSQIIFILNEPSRPMRKIHVIGYK